MVRRLRARGRAGPGRRAAPAAISWLSVWARGSPNGASTPRRKGATGSLDYSHARQSAGAEARRKSGGGRATTAVVGAQPGTVAGPHSAAAQSARTAMVHGPLTSRIRHG